MTIVWSRRAVGHLAHLRSYLAAHNPSAAAILEAIERLAEMPNPGRPGRVTGTRELVVTGTKYLVPYRVRGDRVEIIAVFHSGQKWPARL